MIPRIAVVIAVATGCGGGAVHPPQVVAINRTAGEMADVDGALVAEHVTIVDFWASWCGACDRIDAMLLADIADEPRIVVRKVDVGEGQTPVARAYDVGTLPHLRIFDRHRRLRYVLVGNDAIRTAELARALLDER